MAKKKKHATKPEPCFSLKEVKELLRINKYRITGKALKSARSDFNWNSNDIVKALLKLQKEDHYKRNIRYEQSDIMMDIYKAHINGQYIYLHYYIDDDDNLLIVGSFKAV